MVVAMLGSRGTVRALAALAALWLAVVLLVTLAPLTGGGGEAVSSLVQRLDSAVEELAALRRQNDELRGLLVDFTE